MWKVSRLAHTLKFSHPTPRHKRLKRVKHHAQGELISPHTHTLEFAMAPRRHPQTLWTWFRHKTPQHHPQTIWTRFRHTRWYLSAIRKQYGHGFAIRDGTTIRKHYEASSYGSAIRKHYEHGFIIRHHHPQTLWGFAGKLTGTATCWPLPTGTVACCPPVNSPVLPPAVHMFTGTTACCPLVNSPVLPPAVHR